jgi:hypothetical protein
MEVFVNAVGKRPRYQDQAEETRSALTTTSLQIDYERRMRVGPLIFCSGQRCVKKSDATEKWSMKIDKMYGDMGRPKG